jgi:hypothetical protein
MDSYLWTIENGTLFRTSIKAMKWEQIGKEGDFEETIAIVAEGGFLWSVEQDGTLFKNDKNGNYMQVGDKGLLKDVNMIAAMGGKLYVVENGTLYRTTN